MTKYNPDKDYQNNLILIDLDGTLAEYDHWRGEDHIGEPIEGAKEFVLQLKADGYQVMIWSTRLGGFNVLKDKSPEDVERNAAIVQGWCMKHGIAIDGMLEGKPMCFATIDDRAIRPIDQSYGGFRSAMDWVHMQEDIDAAQIRTTCTKDDKADAEYQTEQVATEHAKRVKDGEQCRI